MAADAVEHYGDRYADWKHWDAGEFGASDPATAQYHDAELARAGLPPRGDLRVLELGFGNGALLALMKGKGWQVTGTEVSEPLVARARAAGYDAHRVETPAGFDADAFDLVVAFDVLEHIPQGALPALLAEVRRVLRPGGVLLARFPNGDSPLGLANQHGDVTHLTTIGSGKARFLAESAGLEPTRVSAPARPLWSRSPARTAYNLVALPPRWLVEKAVKLLFFPGSDIQFFSSNLVLVARKPAAGAMLGSRPAT